MARDFAVSLLQLVVVAAIAPLVPGVLTVLIARLQGRRGPAVIQPYRDLRRLWGRSRITPQPASMIYELTPVISATCAIVALALLPAPGTAGMPGLGDDFLVMIAVLALSRFVLGLSAWDTGNGFALMGAARDLAFAVFTEALFILSIVALALAGGGTGMSTLLSAASEPEAWQQVVRWAAALGLVLVALAETGRRPIDNPETHLELTMVHEGPLLEFGGRDLALLKWAAAARNWIILFVLVLIALPRPDGLLAGGAVVIGWAVAACLLLSFSESMQAKMRILRVPALLAAGTVMVLLGIAAGLWGGLA